MTKTEINTLIKHIQTRVSNLKFYDPQICKRKNKQCGLFEYHFTIKQEADNFDGYRVYFFEQMFPGWQFVFVPDKTKSITSNNIIIEQGEYPTTSTMLFAYATICELLNTLSWQKHWR